MSIATQIQRLQTAKADIKTAIENKGVTIPSNATIDAYPTYVSQITSGGGGSDYEQQLIDLIEKDFTTFNIPVLIAEVAIVTLFSLLLTLAIKQSRILRCYLLGMSK